MKRYLALTLADAKTIRRDPMLMMALCGPLLLILFFTYVPPLAEEWLRVKLHFELSNYYDLLLICLLQLLPLLLGMISGFMLLDERDEHLILLFAVTPLSRSGYLLLRFTVPFLLTVCFSVLLIRMTDFVSIGGLNMLLLVSLLAMEAPLVGLFMVAYAENKVEGLALAKVTGVLIMIPVYVYFVSDPWQYLAAFTPNFWLAHMMFSESTVWSLLDFLVGSIVHGLLFLRLYHRFSRRASE